MYVDKNRKLIILKGWGCGRNAETMGVWGNTLSFKIESERGVGCQCSSGGRCHAYLPSRKLWLRSQHCMNQVWQSMFVISAFGGGGKKRRKGSRVSSATQGVGLAWATREKIIRIGKDRGPSSLMDAAVSLSLSCQHFPFYHFLFIHDDKLDSEMA